MALPHTLPERAKPFKATAFGKADNAGRRNADVLKTYSGSALRCVRPAHALELVPGSTREPLRQSAAPAADTQSSTSPFLMVPRAALSTDWNSSGVLYRPSSSGHMAFAHISRTKVGTWSASAGH